MGVGAIGDHHRAVSVAKLVGGMASGGTEGDVENSPSALHRARLSGRSEDLRQRAQFTWQQLKLLDLRN